MAGTMLRVKFPDNKTYEVPENEIDRAISLGGEVEDESLGFDGLDQVQNEANLQENPHPERMATPDQSQSLDQTTLETPQPNIVKVMFPDNKTYDVPENDLKMAESMGGKIVDPEYNGLLKTAARSAKTIGSEIIGAIPDLATSIYNIPASIQNATNEATKNDPYEIDPISMMPIQRVPGKREDLPLIPSVAHAVESSIDEATNNYTKTNENDSLQAGLRMATAVATPGGVGKLASKAGSQAAAKTLGAVGSTNPVSLASAGVAGAATSEAEKAGYGTAASMGMGLGAGAVAGALASTARNINAKIAIAKMTGNSPKNIDLAGLAAYDKAQLPYTNSTLNQGTALRPFEMVADRLPIIGSRRAKKIRENDKLFAEVVEDSIEKVGSKIVDSDSALDTGSIFKDTLLSAKDTTLDIANGLYRGSANALPKDSKWIPHNIVRNIKKIRESINTLDPSEAEIFILKKLDHYEKQLFELENLPDSKLTIGDDLQLKFKPNDKNASKSLREVAVERLIGTAQSLNETIDWDKITPTGSKGKLRLLQRAVVQDIEDFGKNNPEWLSKYVEAKRFYAKHVGKEGLGNKILKKKVFAEDNPDKIIGNLRNISDFKAVERVLSTTKNGKAFYDSIKYEKLLDLIKGKIVDPTKESVNYSGFARAMENKPTKELIRYLAGDKYNELKTLSDVAKTAVRRNARIPNPSGTAPTSFVLDAIFGLFTVVDPSVALTKASLFATGGVALEWLINNKSAYKWGLEGARKLANGDIKGASIYSKRLEQSMTKDLGEDFVKQFIALTP
jgi:hypothetical protein